jgi:tetratricopeptide (TPR) repeat protein
MHHTDPSHLRAAGAGEVLVLEAEPGAARRACLEAWLRRARESGAEGWLLPCDVDEGGVWAGLNDWLRALLPRIEASEPELLVRHDAEVMAVLPELRRAGAPRRLSLTDTAPPGEQVRNYAADRAYRIGQGVVDLLDAWHRASGAGRWVVACDGFGRRGALVGRFFRELMRRRGHALQITLLAAVDPGEGDAAAASFHAATPVRRARLTLPADTPAPRDREQAAREAAALERAVAGDPVGRELHFHTLVRLWSEAGDSARAAAWKVRMMAACNHLGYYEDAHRHAAPVRAALAAGGEGLPSRWTVVSAVFYALITNGRMEEARELLETEALPKLADPHERVRAHYQMAMMHARYLPTKDLAEAERHLDEARRELARAGLPAANRHFLEVFLNNGLALVRHRQGRAGEAVELTRTGSARLDEELPPEKHRLHRSVLLYNAGQVYASTGAYDDALRAFAAAMEMDPNYSEYYNERGNVLLRMGRHEEALADYRMAVECSAPYPEVWVNLGQCHTLLRRWDEAERAFARAADLDPDVFLARAGRARALLALGRTDEAIDEYGAALVLDGSHALLWANRAALLFDAGRVDESAADLDRAVSLAPDNPALRRSRALALKSLGRADEAAADLDAYLRLAPTAPDRAHAEAELAGLRGAMQAA